MKPSRKVSSGIEDLFRSRFENIINLRHELVVLGGRIAWTFFDETYEALYSEEGRPGVPTRLMVGLHILKHMFDLSDEEVCERVEGQKSLRIRKMPGRCRKKADNQWVEGVALWGRGGQK